MAAITVTPANVAIAAANATVRTVQVGEAVTQAEPLYLKADGKYWLADSDASAETAAAVCIALTPASTDGYVSALFLGQINLGATLVAGTIYCVGATAGEIVPLADVSSAYLTILGPAISTSVLDFKPQATGVSI
jgi:hypothetical protein